MRFQRQPGSGLRTAVVTGLVAAGLFAGGGCIVVNPGFAPGKIVTLQEPETSRKYQLYAPTSYSADRPCALIVVCHGQWPLDWAGAQIDEWKGLAEGKGFIVAAPELLSTSGDSASRVARERQDEEAILSIVSQIRAARSIDTNSVFIYGWLAGAYPAMFTGLKNPDVFRAIALRQPSFDPACFLPCIPYLDHQQSIQVICGFTDLSDFTRPQGIACIEWLRKNRMSVTDEETPGANKREPQAVYSFLNRIVRSQPWLRVTVVEADPARPLAVHFTLQSSAPIDAYLWEFGDGQTSRVASPEHMYATAGTYSVRVTGVSGKKSYTRNLELHVPRTRLGTTAQPEAQ